MWEDIESTDTVSLVARCSQMEYEDLLNDLSNDYDLPQPDIVQAKELEPFHGLFRLFLVQDAEIITLCLAAIRTLARETEGIFTREEMDQKLSYLKPSTRSKVIRVIQKYNWVTSNGIRYEFSERVRTLIMFMFGALTRSEDNFAQDIAVSFAISDLDDITGANEEASRENFEAAIGTLRKIRSQFIRVLEQRSAIEARKLLNRCKNIRESMESIENNLRKHNRTSYKYTLTTEIQAICAEIIRLSQELLTFIQQDIQANARSFGQYLTPEQVEEFLSEASPDLLARIMKKRFSSPIKPLFIKKEDLMKRAVDYLQNKPELQELTPPPPTAEIIKRDVSITRQEGPANDFYIELIARLNQKSSLPLQEAILAETYGGSIYRTGLLVTVRSDLSEHPNKQQFDLKMNGAIIDLIDGPIKQISSAKVELVDSEKQY